MRDYIALRANLLSHLACVLLGITFVIDVKYAFFSFVFAIIFDFLSIRLKASTPTK